MTLYEIGVRGNPSAVQTKELKETLEEMLNGTGLKLGIDVDLSFGSGDFNPSSKSSNAVVFYGSSGQTDSEVKTALSRGIPIVPVVSNFGNHSSEIPASLGSINAIAYSKGGTSLIASTVLHLLGLLRSQRQVFISYRRDEATEAALQLFNEFSAHHFRVFLDTHGVPPTEDFQAILWHELSDTDVVVMLDTATYFDSRWTSVEFRRAQAKGITILRIGWPGVKASLRTNLLKSISLSASDILANDKLDAAKLEEIIDAVERARSISHAQRVTNMQSAIRDAVAQIGGSVSGAGPGHLVQVKLSSGKELTVVPYIGVPTSKALNEAETRGTLGDIAIVYDQIGLLPSWQQHLEWLGGHVKSVRWVKRNEIAWEFSAW